MLQRLLMVFSIGAGQAEMDLLPGDADYGLGLSTVSRIVGEHRGRTEVDFVHGQCMSCCVGPPRNAHGPFASAAESLQQEAFV